LDAFLAQERSQPGRLLPRKNFARIQGGSLSGDERLRHGSNPSSSKSKSHRIGSGNVTGQRSKTTNEDIILRFVRSDGHSARIAARIELRHSEPSVGLDRGIVDRRTHD